MEEDKLEQEINENTGYEQLAMEIYKGLLNAEGFQNVEVKHNVKLLGKSGCKHQIDVYWEFKIAGVLQRVAIESKNYTNEVSIAKVRDFFGVIHDIGNITGIFATKKGFQKGAKLFADYYGIQLKEIRKPLEKDWDGRLKKINVEINIMPISVRSVNAVADFDWLVSKEMISSKEDAKTITYLRGLNAEIFVYDNLGNIITNFLELESELPYDYKEVRNQKHVFQYEDAYLDSNIGKVKIKTIEFTYDIENLSEELVLDADNIVKAIIKDVKSGDIQFFNNDGSLR